MFEARVALFSDSLAVQRHQGVCDLLGRYIKRRPYRAKSAVVPEQNGKAEKCFEFLATLCSVAQTGIIMACPIRSKEFHAFFVYRR